MNLSLRFGLGASLLAVVAAGCWVRYLLDERQREFELAMSRYQRASAGARSPSPGGFGGMSICMGRTDIEPEYLEIIHRSVPPTPESARVWSRFLQPVDMPFTQETPLEAALAFVRKTTRSPDLPSGVILYVDPNGLQEADKTLQSPVQIDLKGVPLSSAPLPHARSTRPGLLRRGRRHRVHHLRGHASSPVGRDLPQPVRGRPASNPVNQHSGRARTHPGRPAINGG